MPPLTTTRPYHQPAVKEFSVDGDDGERKDNTKEDEGPEMAEQQGCLLVDVHQDAEEGHKDQGNMEEDKTEKQD